MSGLPLVDPGDALTREEVERYSRHLMIPEVGVDGQRRLKAARVLCIGAGGLGSPVLLYLAAAGVGTIGIVEDDVVDASNLQRQVIHGQSRIGTSKARSAAASLAEVNPYVRVELHEERLDNSNALRLFAEYDLIIDGTDNFATRYLVNDAAGLLGKPYVWGSILRFDGQASVFWAGHGPCYRCLYSQAPPPGAVPSCGEAGVLGVVCASIGAVQATEAIKLITGVGDPLIGRLLIYDALTMEQRTLAVSPDPGCALCGIAPTITQLQDYEAFCGVVSAPKADATGETTITPIELSAMLAKRARGELDFLLVDVREPNEHAIVAIDGAVLIPQGGFLDGSVLASLPRDRPIVLHCKSGRRSADCLAVLRAAGFTQASHLGGGILQWIDRVEPQKPRY